METPVELDTKSSFVKVDIVMDARSFINGNVTTTEDELIERFGQPDSIDEWNYTGLNGNVYPIRTYCYGSNEYLFNNGHLHRISINSPIPYASKENILKMFNLIKSDNTEIVDTGAAYRAYNCGVPDFWVWNMSESELEGIKISYSKLFEQ